MSLPPPVPGTDPHAFEGDPPGALELDRLVQQARDAMEWRASVAALRGRGRSERGVEVEVTAGGGVVAVTVPDAACADGGQAVAEEILQTVLTAQRDLAAQLVRSSADRFGEDSQQAGTVAAAMDGRFARARVLPREDPQD